MAIGALTLLAYVSGWWREKFFEFLPLAVCLPLWWFMFQSMRRRKPSLAQCILGFSGSVVLAAYSYFSWESPLSYNFFAILCSGLAIVYARGILQGLFHPRAMKLPIE